MKVNNIIKLMAAASGVALLAGCVKNFEEYNVNKHEATPEQAAAVLSGSLFQQIQRTVILYRDGTGTLDSDYQVSYNLCADTWAGYTAPTLGDGRNNGSFYINDNWARSLWVNKYSKSMNAYSRLESIMADAPDSKITAIADIMKVAAMHQVTDYYGPAPYSKVGTSLTPDYDSQESIYRQMLSELDEAIDELEVYSVANPGAKILEDYDLVYGGDPSMWIRFANTLRLRLAMRVVYADPELAQEEAEKSLSDSFGLIDSNSSNAIVSGVSHHPIYEINVNFNDADAQIGASMDCYLNGYNDPRKFLIAKPAKDGELHGVRNGIHNTNWTPYKNTAANVSAPNADNYSIVWMNAAESYFLRAEAALRGWNAGGSAKDFYEAGVRTSFEEWGASGVDAYLQDNTSVPAAFVDVVGNANASAPSSITIAYNDADDFETNLERIMTQKWIALFPNGCEAWAEYRRTRYPKLVTPANNDSNGEVNTDLQIRRVPYPISEQSENAKGLSTGLSALGGLDNAGTKLWWDKK
ncbi:MAG: SusD/RagB family nutrient-binding outer membrane lipoprotein [Bacteroidales bacterium]|nr:SusD/RagB family nutrient-binding outer membrane lipoprotein [Bacteroides sp.]MCM1197613.1 SusD/RagB family nutrient-binding outer membrane lipoprotein [Clostridium sp.]MCM1502361.1 SusD/RagB family nutrient-binding outer membrane lipoprotein [Bacteroidales bacterium]